jgi:hypothetical protein
MLSVSSVEVVSFNLVSDAAVPMPEDWAISDRSEILRLLCLFVRKGNFIGPTRAHLVFVCCDGLGQIVFPSNRHRDGIHEIRSIFHGVVETLPTI